MEGWVCAAGRLTRHVVHADRRGTSSPAQLRTAPWKCPQKWRTGRLPAAPTVAPPGDPRLPSCPSAPPAHPSSSIHWKRGRSGLWKRNRSEPSGPPPASPPLPRGREPCSAPAVAAGPAPWRSTNTRYTVRVPTLKEADISTSHCLSAVLTPLRVFKGAGRGPSRRSHRYTTRAYCQRGGGHTEGSLRQKNPGTKQEKTHRCNHACISAQTLNAKLLLFFLILKKYFFFFILSACQFRFAILHTHLFITEVNRNLNSESIELVLDKQRCLAKRCI